MQQSQREPLGKDAYSGVRELETQKHSKNDLLHFG